jgi:hypothetical protein
MFREDSVPTSTLASTPAPAAGGVYEMKFLAPESGIEAIAAWARVNMAPDSHVDPSWGGYVVSSLYFDTPSLAVYHRVAPHDSEKYRARRYGSERFLFLERKAKRRGRVTKRRTLIPEEELSLLGPSEATDWCGEWFRDALEAGPLSPTCRITYRRLAFLGVSSGERVRLTIDRSFRCAEASDLALPEVCGGTNLLAGMSIIEMKFPTTLPALFKELLRDVPLRPSRISKYRLGLRASGRVPDPGGEETPALSHSLPWEDGKATTVFPVAGEAWG